jgi:hypothetical protein
VSTKTDFLELPNRFRVGTALPPDDSSRRYTTWFLKATGRNEIRELLNKLLNKPCTLLRIGLNLCSTNII